MAMRETVEARNLDNAISGLYKLFPHVSSEYNGCPKVKTKEVSVLKKKIARRNRELDKIKAEDKELKKLHKEMKELICSTASKANALYVQVDALKRKFQLRGVSPELIEEVENMALVKPVITEDCVCEDDDED